MPMAISSRPSVPANAYVNTFAGIEGGLLYPPDESGGFSVSLKLPLSYKNDTLLRVALVS